MKSFYQELELSETCTKDEIKRSYRKLAMIHHPDRGGNEETFKTISQAYETLSDDNKRKNYDQSRSKNIPFPFFNQFGNFTRTGARQPEKKKITINYDLELELRELYLGCTKDIAVTYTTNCSCYTICPYCRGQGKTQNMIRQGPFVQMYEKICDVCIGKGYSVKADCEECDEIGKYEKTSKLKITFHPKIMCKKIKIPLSQQQELQSNSDLKHVKNEIEVIINVNIKKDLLFEVKEDIKSGSINLIYRTEIDFVDSICGKDITIPLFQEDLFLNINTYEKFGIIQPEKEYLIFLSSGTGPHNSSLNQEPLSQEPLGLTSDSSTSIKKYGDLIIIFNVNYQDKKYTEEEREQIRKLLN